jgi:hypothetical protein
MGDRVQPGQSDAALLHALACIRPDLQVAGLAQLGMTDTCSAMNDSACSVGGSDHQVATFGSPWVYDRCRKPGRPG